MKHFRRIVLLVCDDLQVSPSQLNRPSTGYVQRPAAVHAARTAIALAAKRVHPNATESDIAAKFGYASPSTVSMWITDRGNHTGRYPGGTTANTYAHRIADRIQQEQA